MTQYEIYYSYEPLEGEGVEDYFPEKNWLTSSLNYSLANTLGMALEDISWVRKNRLGPVVVIVNEENT